MFILKLKKGKYYTQFIMKTTDGKQKMGCTMVSVSVFESLISNRTIDKALDYPCV